MTIVRVKGIFVVFFVVFSIICLFSQITLATDEVGMFRNNLFRNGVFNTKGVKELNGVKWKFKTAGAIMSSPIVKDGAVYFGSDDKSIYAVNAGSGKEIWKYTTGNIIRATPIITNDRVFISNADGILFAINRSNGKLIWKYTTGRLEHSYDDWDYWFSSPLLYNGIIYYCAPDRKVYALNAGTGEKVWEFNLHGVTHSSPLLVDNTLYVVTLKGNMYAINIKDGKEVWKKSVCWKTVSSFAYSQGYIILTARIYQAGEFPIIAIEAKSGEEVWKYMAKRGSWFQSSPAVYKNIVYAGSSDSSKVVALNLKDGEEKWEFHASGPVHSSPAIADGLLYFGSSDNYNNSDVGYVYAIDLNSGKQVWKLKTGLIYTSPAINNGVLFVGSKDGYLYAIY